MSEIQNRFFFKGKLIEVKISKTLIGDYIATASFSDNLHMGICRSYNLEYAKKKCVDRLIEISKYI